MPIREDVVEVALSVPQQITPKTAGLTGTLQRLLDGQVVKFQPSNGGAARIRVDKRDAFFTLSDVVRDTLDGSVQMGATLDGQSLLQEFGDRLLLVSNDKTHVYSNATAAWERHGYQLAPYSLRQDFVHTANTLATVPDIAHAEGVSCHTWVNEADHNAGGGAPTELAGCYFKVVDADGVTLRASSRINPTDRRVKVVSDGGNFWIVSDIGNGTGTVKVRVVDRHGLELAQTTFAVTSSANDPFDVVSTSFGILVAQPTGTGVEFSKLSYALGVITRVSNVDETIFGFHRFGFATNDVDGNAWLETIDRTGADVNNVYVYRITSGLVQDYGSLVTAAEADEIANITGYVVPGTAGDVVVAFSIIDDTAPPNTDPLANVIREYYVPFGGSATFTKTLRSMNLASRAFALQGHYYYVGYYPSSLVEVSATEELPNQPTYFLCPLNNLTQSTAGRWEYGIAYADWQTSGSKYRFALSSCVVLFPSGMRVALSYRAESFTSTRLQVNGDITLRVQTQGTTVGIKSYSFGDPGQAVVLANELLLPGPGASSWSGGEFSEHNVALAFEPPTVAITATGGTYLTPGTYQWVVVGEWTDENGNRVRSAPSIPVTRTVATTGKVAALAGKMMHATNKRDLLISIYRTDMLPDAGGGYVPSTLHYKITVDAPTATDAPLYNDNNQAIWQFDDANVVITANEILYTDKGQLANYPAPAFSRGCMWQGRACVLGPDRAIWVSGPRTEGDATWFHPAFRLVVPTDDEPVAVAATTESYLVVLCRKTMWYFPSTALPDASGSGNLPEAVELKFNMGCTGQALTTGIGTFFSSSADSVWLLPRDLSAPKWVAQPLADALDGPVAALGIDAHQRVYAVVGNTLGVYDMVSGCWYEWSTPNNVQLLASYQGAVTFGDGTLVWQQLSGNYVDTQFQADVQTLLPYNMSVELNSIHFGAVRNFASLLEIQAIGDTHEAGTVTMALKFDDNPDVVESTSWVTDPSVPFEYSYGPENQLCSAVGITLTEGAAPGQISGRGFSVELLSLTVGLYGGQNRLPDNRRV